MSSGSGEKTGKACAADESDKDVRIDNERTHTHCECVEELKAPVEVFEAEKSKLQMKCKALEGAIQRLSSVNSHVFSIDRIKVDDKLISFYRGFSSFLVFLSRFTFLRRSEKNAPVEGDEHRPRGS